MQVAQIRRRPLASSLFIVPNIYYFFGKIEQEKNLFKIVHSINLDDMATIHFTKLGAIGYEFNPRGCLASKEILETVSGGVVPDEVRENEEEIVSLQENRMLFANFVSGAFFGRVCAQKHRPLQGAIYNGLDIVFGLIVKNGAILLPGHGDAFKKALGPKLAAVSTGQFEVLQQADIEDAGKYIQQLWERGKEFQYADLQACMVMNYQAAILHQEQHATASLALSFSLMETLIKEIFHAYGLVGAGAVTKSFANRPHSLLPISKKVFKEATLSKLLDLLRDGKLIDFYLHRRIDAARKKRNELMHQGEGVSCRDTGNYLTAVRDLWMLLIDGPFELITGWTRRF